MTKTTETRRWWYLAVGTAAILAAGIVYAWSILKAPLGAAFGWSASQLTLNYTLVMCCFCLGGIVGGFLGKRLGCQKALLLAAAAFGLNVSIKRP